MIPRYSRPEMTAIWSDEYKFQKWLDVEIAVVQAWADHGEVQPVVCDQVARDSLDVFRRHRIELRQVLGRLHRLAFEHLAVEAVHDQALRVLRAQDEAPLGHRPRLLELVVGDALHGASGNGRIYLWNGDAARAWRRDLREHGRFPACTRCDMVY